MCLTNTDIRHKEGDKNIDRQQRREEGDKCVDIIGINDIKRDIKNNKKLQIDREKQENKNIGKNRAS